MREHAGFLALIGGAPTVVGGILITVGVAQASSAKGPLALWSNGYFVAGVALVGLGLLIEVLAVYFYFRRSPNSADILGRLQFIAFVPEVAIHAADRTGAVRVGLTLANASDSVLAYRVERYTLSVNGHTLECPHLGNGSTIAPHAQDTYTCTQRLSLGTALPEHLRGTIEVEITYGAAGRTRRFRWTRRAQVELSQVVGQTNVYVISHVTLNESDTEVR